MTRLDVIQKIINKTGAATYLEIGVFRGETFYKVKAKRKIAVDPALKDFSEELRKSLAAKSVYIIGATSDYFFQQYKYDKGLDVVFVDGLHTFDQSLKDILNSLKNLNDKGVIIIHDCLPPDEASACPAESYNQAAALNPPAGTENGAVMSGNQSAT